MIGALLLAATVAASPAPDSTAANTTADAAAVPPASGEAIARIGYHDPRLRPPGLRPPTLSLSLLSPRPLEGVGLLGSPLRTYELSRIQTTLKGVSMASNTAMLLGAMSTQWGWWDEKTSWWMVGGAVAAGALYGSTLGYESESFSVDVRVGDD